MTGSIPTKSMLLRTLGFSLGTKEEPNRSVFSPRLPGRGEPPMGYRSKNEQNRDSGNHQLCRHWTGKPPIRSKIGTNNTGRQCDKAALCLLLFPPVMGFHDQVFCWCHTRVTLVTRLLGVRGDHQSLDVKMDGGDWTEVRSRYSTCIVPGTGVMGDRLRLLATPVRRSMPVVRVSRPVCVGHTACR